MSEKHQGSQVNASKDDGSEPGSDEGNQMGTYEKNRLLEILKCLESEEPEKQDLEEQDSENQVGEPGVGVKNNPDQKVD